MKASVVIRAYNAQETVQRAVESAIRQDFPRESFEVLVINDGSTDDTKNILSFYEGKEGIRIFHQENKGAIVSANNGFEASKGEYVVLLDSDDYAEPGLVRELASALDEHQEASFAFPDYYEEYKGSRTVVSPQNLFESTAAGTMFKRAKLLEIGGYRTDMEVFYEYDLLLRTLGKWKFIHVQKPLFTYCRREGSVMDNPLRNERGLQRLRELHPDKLREIQKIRTYAMDYG